MLVKSNLLDKDQPRRPAAVVMGASAGGIEPLLTVLRSLPANYNLPMIVVVHLPAAGKDRLVDVFQAHVAIPVRQAQDKAPVEAGVLYFAGPGYHLSIESDLKFSLSDETPVHFSRPSIDIMMRSAADAYRQHLVGILLSGASQDGAAGLAAIHHAGGMTVVQDPLEAQFPAMPQAALNLCPEHDVLKTNDIQLLLMQLGSH